MLLPANCPYAWYTPIPWNETETIACCRAHRPLWEPDERDEPPLCRCPGEEAYRFHWSSSFDGHATVRIVRQGDEVVLHWSYFPFHRGHGVASLTMSDWERLQEALTLASFWLLDPRNDLFGFDGATWTIEGRCKGSFQIVERWSPESGGFRKLGSLFFALAGQPLSGVKLY
jgi:hypothetical protein